MEVTVATKFAALPWRLGRQSVLAALKDSLFRLGLSSVELYQLHWSASHESVFCFFFFLNFLDKQLLINCLPWIFRAGIWGNEGYLFLMQLFR